MGLADLTDPPEQLPDCSGEGATGASCDEGRKQDDDSDPASGVEQVELPDPLSGLLSPLRTEDILTQMLYGQVLVYASKPRGTAG